MTTPIVPTETKEFTFVKNATTVVKNYVGTDLAHTYSVTIRRGSVVLNLTSAEFEDFFAVINDAYNHDFTPDD